MSFKQKLLGFTGAVAVAGLGAGYVLSPQSQYCPKGSTAVDVASVTTANALAIGSSCYYVPPGGIDFGVPTEDPRISRSVGAPGDIQQNLDIVRRDITYLAAFAMSENKPLLDHLTKNVPSNFDAKSILINIKDAGGILVTKDSKFNEVTFKKTINVVSSTLAIFSSPELAGIVQYYNMVVNGKFNDINKTLRLGTLSQKSLIDLYVENGYVSPEALKISTDGRSYDNYVNSIKVLMKYKAEQIFDIPSMSLDDFMKIVPDLGTALNAYDASLVGSIVSSPVHDAFNYIFMCKHITEDNGYFRELLDPLVDMYTLYIFETERQNDPKFNPALTLSIIKNNPLFKRIITDDKEAALLALVGRQEDWMMYLNRVIFSTLGKNIITLLIGTLLATSLGKAAINGSFGLCSKGKGKNKNGKRSTKTIRKSVVDETNDDSSPVSGVSGVSDVSGTCRYDT